MSPQDARRIIVQGDARFLVERAQNLAEEASAAKVTRTSIRRLYGEVKRIELLWEKQPQQASRRAVLFKPRLAYQASRDQKLRDLRQPLESLLDAVEGDRQRFQRFVEFFEALVAYMRDK